MYPGAVEVMQPSLAPPRLTPVTGSDNGGRLPGSIAGAGATRSSRNQTKQGNSQLSAPSSYHVIGLGYSDEDEKDLSVDI